MKSLVGSKGKDIDQNVLLIGNNPMDLGTIYDRLKKVTHVNYITEILFDVSNIVKKVLKYRPKYIIIDDNLSKEDMRGLLSKLKTHHRTMDIPITIVQNSNADDKPREGAEEFILKDSITSESISRSLVNSLKFSQMQSYLKKAYIKRKKLLQGFK